MMFLERVYRTFRQRLWEDDYFSTDDIKQIMRQLNSAILEAQREVYTEVVDSEP